MNPHRSTSRLMPARRSPLEGGEAREFPHVKAIAYILTLAGGRTLVKAYSGKRNRPDFFFGFIDRGAADAYLEKWVAGLEAADKSREERRRAKREFVHSLKVGDVLVSEWGYDQTNVDFYEVVAVAGKAVEIRPIGKEYEENGFMSGKCVPVPGKFTGEKSRHIVSQGNHVKVSQCSHARPAEFSLIAGMRIYRAHYSSSYA